MAVTSSAVDSLSGLQVVEPEHHEGVGVGENPLVNGKPEASAWSTRWNTAAWVACDLAREPLEVECGAMEQLEACRRSPAGNCAAPPLRLLVGWPHHRAHFGHGREAILHRGRIALRLERKAPGPVDAQPAFARCVLAGDVVLVIGAGGQG